MTLEVHNFNTYIDFHILICHLHLSSLVFSSSLLCMWKLGWSFLTVECEEFFVYSGYRSFTRCEI